MLGEHGLVAMRRVAGPHVCRVPMGVIRDPSRGVPSAHPSKTLTMTTLLTIAAFTAATGCSSSSKATKAAAASPVAATGSPTGQVAQAPGIATVPGYHVAIFAKAAGPYSNPDLIVVDRQSVYVVFQNVTAKDRQRRQIQHRRAVRPDGQVLKTFDVPGHNDGLRRPCKPIWYGR